MNYREKSHKMLIRDEGLVLRSYKCPAGFNTLGVGRNLDARGVNAALLLYYRTVGITREKAMEWLDEDVGVAEIDCRIIFGNALFESWSENRRLGFVNFAFNLGRDRMMKFVNMLRHARNQDWKKVRLHLENSLWYRQVKSRGPRVVALICDERWDYD